MISDGTGKDIFELVPANPKSKFILVEGGHGDVSECGKDVTLGWLKGVEMPADCVLCIVF